MDNENIIDQLSRYKSLTEDQKLELEYKIHEDWKSERKIDLSLKRIRKSLIKGYRNIINVAA